MACLSPAHATPTTPIHYRPFLGTHFTNTDRNDGHTGSPHYAKSSSTSPRTPRSLITEPENGRSPYTPSSGQSFPSSFTSPLALELEKVVDPDALSPQHRRSFYASPNNQKNSQKSHNTKTKTSSLADQIDNWRTRAQLNGIKVAADANKYDNLLQLNEENQHQLTIARHKLPACFSTPPPKRNREFIYMRGAYTAPMDFPQRSLESPIVETSHWSPEFPFATDSTQGQTLLSPLRELTSLINIHSTPGEASLLSPSFFPAASTNIVTPASDYQSVPASFTSDETTSPTSKSNCTVCDKQPSESFRMIVLSPCSHIFCSSCFTGTLNIVGEKNMSCMECNTPVQSFHFTLNLEGKSDSAHALDGSCASFPSRSLDELAFKLADLTAGVKGIPRKLIDSTIPDQRLKTTCAEGPLKTDQDISVLRIDNIPWDVTPSALQEFFKLPLCSVHTLLDLKGKTLSHAFVRLATSDARIALRSTQNAVLGKGRRSRAVTVTLASLDELLMAIYPYWRGTFKNGVPSLDGLDTERVKDALSHGLVSKEELNALRELMLNPNSPFLKVPRLPFSSLINILVTFPSDVDSQIFWNSETRDMLYGKTQVIIALACTDLMHDALDVTMVAVNIVTKRVLETNAGLDLLLELRDAVANCKIFTDLQRLTMVQIMTDSVECNQFGV